MAFNTKKCKVMHVGRQNLRQQYTMGNHILEASEEERDIGVQVSSNLKPSSQCAKAARTANAVLGQISRAFHYRDRSTFLRLYVQAVCSASFGICSASLEPMDNGRLGMPGKGAKKGSWHGFWVKNPGLQ